MLLTHVITSVQISILISHRTLKATVQLSTQINNIRTPGIGNSELWKEISWATPLGTPGMVDGKLVRLENTIDDENPWQALLNNGYNNTYAYTINSTLRLTMICHVYC